jgi:Arc/MetJ-type ribon-helix-helix transcriptional regulator
VKGENTMSEKFKPTHIRLTEKQYNQLRRESFETGKSQSEIIREALEMRWARKKEEKRMKELTVTVKKCLFEDIFADVMHELVDLAEKGRIPEWGSYDVDKIERSYPIIDYHISLHAGPVETPGRVVATAYIHTVDGEDQADVTITWEEAAKVILS